jgi:hypothetical protein
MSFRCETFGKAKVFSEGISKKKEVTIEAGKKKEEKANHSDEI